MTFIITIIAIGIIGLIGLELFFSHRREFKTYTLSDSIVNLSCGMIERLFNFFTYFIYYIAFGFIFDHFAIFQLPNTWWSWVLAIIVADFISYWFHRLSHEVNFLWAAHIVHHQSEELNITTVFRVSFFAVIFRFFFFMWMPVVGFSPEMVVGSSVVIGLFQFVTHSRLVGKLGILEFFFTTPSHHRVHHARNDKYIDRNYSHIFIIWDRIFGTFTEEDEEPDYGITSGFESVNPFWAQFQYWKDLFVRAGRTKSWSNKLKIFFAKPTWTPEDSPYLDPVFSTDEKGERKQFRFIVKPELGAYLLLSVMTTFVAFLIVVVNEIAKDIDQISAIVSNPHNLLFAAFVLFSIQVHTRMMRNPKSGFWLELVRIVGLGLLLVNFFKDAEQANVINSVIVAVSIAMIIWLTRLYRYRETMSFQA